MTNPIQIDYISVSTTKTVSVLEHDKTYPDRLYFSIHYKNRVSTRTHRRLLAYLFYHCNIFGTCTKLTINYRRKKLIIFCNIEFVFFRSPGISNVMCIFSETYMIIFLSLLSLYISVYHYCAHDAVFILLGKVWRCQTDIQKQ